VASPETCDINHREYVAGDCRFQSMDRTAYRKKLKHLKAMLCSNVLSAQCRDQFV